MTRIAFTFAGREDRMQQELAFMQGLLDAGVIDEWHIWNFTRNDDDDAWLRGLGHPQVMLTGRGSPDYAPFGDGTPTRWSAHVEAVSNAGVLATLSTGGMLEFALGSHENKLSWVRTFPTSEYVPSVVPQGSAPVALRVEGGDDIELVSRSGAVTVELNGDVVFNAAGDDITFGQVLVRTGFGSAGLWSTGDVSGRVKLYNSNERGYAAFRSVYEYYSHSSFSDAVFLKLDDDVVYLDPEKVDGMLSAVEASPRHDIWSANVINNGVCAHFQQQWDYFPGLEEEFEYPKGINGWGDTGTLWESSEKAAALHAYFLEHFDEIRAKARAGDVFELPATHRLSINVVAFKQPVMPLMALAYGMEATNDDEQIMTVVLPKRFGLRKFLYQPLLAAHLSFYEQEKTLDPTELLEGYARLGASLAAASSAG